MAEATYWSGMALIALLPLLAGVVVAWGVSGADGSGRSMGRCRDGGRG